MMIINLLRSFKRKLPALFFVMISCFSFSQVMGIYESYAILNINQTSNPTYFDMQASTANPDFQSTDLGVFGSGSSLVVNGGQNKTYKNSGGDVTDGNFYYRVYLSSAPPSAGFQVIPLTFLSNDGPTLGNQSWEGKTWVENFISGLTIPGNYTVEVYSQSTGIPATVYSSNGGANFKANFTYAPTDYTWNGSTDSSWATPANWTPTGIPVAIDNVTINIAGTNPLNINANRTVNNFTLNGSGSFSANAFGSLTINGDFTYENTATALLHCSSTLNIAGSTTQFIPAMTYGNLNISGGDRILSATGNIKICSEFSADVERYRYEVSDSTVEFTSDAAATWSLVPFTYHHLNFSGKGNFSLGASDPSKEKSIIVLGNVLQSGGNFIIGDSENQTATLTIEGNMTVEKGSFDVNRGRGGKGVVNLKGDLTVLDEGELNASSDTILGYNYFNFKGRGDGSSDEATQTIDVVNGSTAKRINFNVKSDAYVKLINQDFALGSSSAFNVDSGATLDFGFKWSTALNLKRAGTETRQTFTSRSGSTLKISSAEGISLLAGVGNVQTPAGGRTYHPDAIFHYIGKANAAQMLTTGVDQVSGNGLTNDASAKNIIIELETVNSSQDDVSFKAIGIKKLTDSGSLTIIRGKVIDEPTNGFADGTSEDGALIMSGGRYVISRGGSQPSLGGTYTLTGGVIDFAGNSAISIRTSRNYLNVEVSGSQVSASTGDTSGLTFLSGGTFRVKDNGTFLVRNPQGFSGTGATAIRTTNSPTVFLEPLSTIDYIRQGNQLISKDIHSFPLDAHYQNLKISGTGIKTASGTTIVKNITTVASAELLVPETTNAEEVNVFWATKGLSVTTGAIFRLANNANLLQNANITNSGNITQERKATVPSIQYNYWSSPVKSQHLYSLYPDIPANRVMIYSSSNDKFISLPTASNPLSVFAKGYSIKGSANPGYVPNLLATFVGEPNNESTGANSILLSTAGSNYNLIGNPFPSNLNLVEWYNDPENSAKFYNEADETPTAYLWDNTSNTDLMQLGSGYVNQNYAMVNLSTGTGTPAPRLGIIGKLPNGIVRPGQGFIMRAAESGGSLIFKNNLMRTSAISMGGTNSQYYKGTSGNDDKFYLRLTTAKNMNFVIAVAYHANAENTWERFDSAIMSEAVTENFYSLSTDLKKLAIQTRKGDFDVSDKVLLGIKTAATGDQTLGVEDKKGIFASGQNIYLKDKLLNSLTNLSEGQYLFSTVQGIDENRFEIVFSPEINLATENNVVNELQIYRQNEHFVIRSKSKKIVEVEFYEVSGRLLLKLKSNSTHVLVDASALPQGVSICKVTFPDEIRTKKVLK